MNLDRLGFLGLIALIIVVMGAWNFLVRTATQGNPDNKLSQAAAHFW